LNLKVLKVKSEIALRKLGKSMGYDLKMTDEERFILLLENNRIDLIFDIGANTGQYAEMLFELGYKGKIVSFEPLTSAYDILKEKRKSNPNWIVAERCAIGDTDGEIYINISENSVSSSILKVMDSHLNSEPGSKTINCELTKIYKLDTIAKQYIGSAKNLLIKIDTQGYEENVLNGATDTINFAKGLQIELSLVKLYEGQKLFNEILERVTGLGFSLMQIEPSFTDKETGRMLQVDGIFFRE